MLHERGSVFSKREAWLYITNILAQGVERNGLKRGEFEASYRYLGKAWSWDVARVYRFMGTLIEAGMLEKVKHLAQHLAQQEAQHFKVTNYETYNPKRNTSNNTFDNTQRNKLKEGINEGINEGESNVAEGATSVLPPPSEMALRLSERLRVAISTRDPASKAAKLPKKHLIAWARDIEKLIKIDGRKAEDCEAVIDWCQEDGNFWNNNILSGRKLREKFDTLYGQMRRVSPAKKTETMDDFRAKVEQQANRVRNLL